MIPHVRGPVFCSLLFFAATSLYLVDGNDLTNSTKVRTVVVRAGDNVSLVCEADGNRSNESISWIHETQFLPDDGNKLLPNRRFHLQSDGSLFISSVSVSDPLSYTCADAETNDSLETIILDIKSVPPPVTNLTVITHSVFALLSWSIAGKGGYPIKNFVLAYRLSLPGKTTQNDTNESSDPAWKVISDISGSSTSKTIFGLKPNATYVFRLYAVNELGSGPSVTSEADTKNDPDEIEEANRLWTESKNGSFYMKVTVIILIVTFVTFAILGLGISLVLFRNCSRKRTDISCETLEEDESMELVPHITLNPSFNIDMLEYLEAEDDSPLEERAARAAMGRREEAGGADLFSDDSTLVDLSTEKPKR